MLEYAEGQLFSVNVFLTRFVSHKIFFSLEVYLKISGGKS